ncbi:type I secretion system permease/ATPase [Ruegeria sp. SCP11]|uniref:type I secretion system permease/ATPase n=1 Tax=Ruegeria sp. SCP11 TaxID=3141378 RepID=UPI003339F1D2
MFDTDLSPGQADFKKTFRQIRYAQFVLVGFGCVVNFLYLATPLYMLQVYDRVLASKRLETLLYLSLIALFAVLILGALEMLRGMIQVRMGNWLDQRLSGRLVGSSVRAALIGAQANTQPVRDLHTIRNFLSSGQRALLDIPWSPLFLVALWILHPWLGILGICSAVLLFLVAAINELISRRPAQSANGARVTNLNMIDRTIQNADVIQAMGMLPRLIKLWNFQNAEMLKDGRTAGDRSAIMQGLSRFIRLGAQVLVLGLGAYLVILGDLTGGSMIAGSILLGRALAPVEQVIGSWRSFLSARSAKERIKTVLSTAPEMGTSTHLPTPLGRVQAQNVWLTMSFEKPILQNVSFSVEPGEVLAITGPSASGKTSLCKLIVGSWLADKGRICLDGADISQWDNAQLGEHVGYLPQDVELFPTTIAQNISRFEEGDNSKEIIEAAKSAQAHELITSLPKHYDTVVGANGQYLSGGQRQRVGLARAFYRNPKLIVLDEPNANLDSQGEDALLAALEIARKWGATIIMVTHSRRLLQPADKIMVLVGGVMHSFGERDEVLKLATLPKNHKGGVEAVRTDEVKSVSAEFTQRSGWLSP